jgi:hypothetical protein
MYGLAMKIFLGVAKCNARQKQFFLAFQKTFQLVRALE